MKKKLQNIILYPVFLFGVCVEKVMRAFSAGIEYEEMKEDARRKHPFQASQDARDHLP